MESGTARDNGPQSKLERARDLAARASSLQPSDPSLRRGLHAGIAIVLVLGVGLAVVAALGDFPDGGPAVRDPGLHPLPLRQRGDLAKIAARPRSGPASAAGGLDLVRVGTRPLCAHRAAAAGAPDGDGRAGGSTEANYAGQR